MNVQLCTCQTAEVYSGEFRKKLNSITFTLKSLASKERKSMLLISERINSLESKEQNIWLAKIGKEAQERYESSFGS